MKITTICLRVAAMLCGTALIASMIIQNLEKLGPALAYSGYGLAAVAVPISVAIMVPVVDHAFGQRRHLLAAIGSVMILCGLAHTFTVALERGVLVREQGSAAITKENRPAVLAKARYARAEERVAKIEDELREHRKTGCGSGCRSAEADLVKAKADLASAEAAFATAGSQVDADSMVTKYGTLAKVIDTWHPALLPMAIELGALVLIGFAFGRDRTKPNPLAQPATVMPTKQEEAEVIIRELGHEMGRLPSLPEAIEAIGEDKISRSTVWRALKTISREAA